MAWAHFRSARASHRGQRRTLARSGLHCARSLPFRRRSGPAARSAAYPAAPFPPCERSRAQPTASNFRSARASHRGQRRTLARSGLHCARSLPFRRRSGPAARSAAYPAAPFPPCERSRAQPTASNLTQGSLSAVPTRRRLLPAPALRCTGQSPSGGPAPTADQLPVLRSPPCRRLA